MSKNNVRIAIRDSTDSHNVAFFDNKAGIKYKSANLQRFLAGSASILTIKYNSKDIDSIRSGCKLAFRYKNRDYWLNVMSFEKKGFEVELTAYSLGLELNNETRGEHKPSNAMSIAEYVGYYDPEHALTIGVNEVSDKRIKLEWTGTDTILARLFSVANSFGAELDFSVELNDDYSLKRQVLNIYKKGNLGTNKVSQPVRVGKELKVINYSDNIKELRTAVRATGKDGLTIDGLNKKIYDNNKELLYYSSGMTVYAPQSRDRFPSVGKGSNDNWIVEDLGETQYETKEALWGYLYSEIQKKSLPEITYEVEGAIEAGIGDTQTLIDDIHFEPPLYVQARVSELEDDILTGKVTKSTFINFERKYSQIADILLKQVEALAEDAAPYIVRLTTDNGYIFKNGQGTSTITAKLEKYSKDIAATWKWVVDNKVVGTGDKLTVKAEQVTNTMAVTVIAYVNGNEVVRDYMTFSNSDDGVGVASIDRYFTSSDQSDGVTIEGAEWSDKPPAPTEDGKYLWAYDEITYTDGTVTTTRPAAVGANFDVDAFRAEIAEDLKDVPNREEFENKIAEELANSKAEIETQIETAKTQAESNAKEYADTINGETAKVAELANAAAGEIKADLVNVKNNLTSTSLVANNAKAEVDAAKRDLTNVTSELNTAKQDLTSHAQQLQTQASAQTELSKRVTTVETTANGTKTTVSELSKTVDGNTKNITSVTARTKTVEDDLAGTKTTLSQVQTTANSTSQKTATLETGLNGLSARFNSLSVGNKNYLPASRVVNRGCSNFSYSNTTKSWTMTAPASSSTFGNGITFNTKELNILLNGGETLFFGLMIKANKACSFKYDVNNALSGTTSNDNDDTSKRAHSPSNKSIPANVWTKVWFSYTAKANVAITENNSKFGIVNNTEPVTIEIKEVMVAKSNVPVDYQAPDADLEQKVAEYKQTADQNYASLQSNLQTLDGTVKQNKSEFDQTASQIRSSISAVEGKIPTNIGARNYIRDYGLTATGWGNASAGWKFEIISDSTAKSGQYLKATCTTASASGGGFYKNLFDFSDGRFFGKQMTWAMDIKLSKAKPVKIGPEWGYAYLDINATTEWKRYSKTFTVATTTEYNNWIFYTNDKNWNAGDIVYIRDVQLEDGSIATSPVPAIEDTESDITKLSSELTQTKDGITLLATKTELNSAKTELQSGINAATNKADAAQNTANSAQDKANSNAQTISTHTTQISALNTGLQAKVSQSDFNTLSGRVTTAENNITAKANELSSKITSVEGKIPTEIGSVNLFKGSRDFSGTDWIGGAGVYVEEYKGVKIFKKQDIWGGRSQYFEVKTGEEYIFSAYVKSSAKTDRVAFYLANESKQPMATGLVGFDSANSQNSVSFDLTDKYKRIAIKIKITKDGWIAPRIERYNSDNYLFFGGYKLERGNIASDWTPAPDDTVVGGRNYALKTGDSKSSTSGGRLYDLSSAFDNIADDATLIIEFNWSVTAPTSTSKFRINRVITYSDGTAEQWNDTIVADGVYTDVSSSRGSGHYSGTFTKVPYNGKAVSSRYLYLNQSTPSGTVTVSNLSVRVGSLKSDWQAAPEDYDSKLATAQSEIKQTTDAIKASVTSLDNSTVKSSSLTINADGIVMKAGKSTTDVANAIGSYFAVNQNAINLFSDKINVKGNMIVSGAITSDKISSKSINTAHLNGKIITADVISSNAVTTSAIKAGAVTTDKMSANSINGDRIAAGTLDAAKIKAGSITASQIASGTITSNQIKAGGISSANIAAGAITGDKIAAGAIDANKIAANAITANMIRGGQLRSTNEATVFDLNAGTLTFNNNYGYIQRVASDKVFEITTVLGKDAESRDFLTSDFTVRKSDFSRQAGAKFTLYSMGNNKPTARATIHADELVLFDSQNTTLLSILAKGSFSNFNFQGWGDIPVAQLPSCGLMVKDIGIGGYSKSLQKIVEELCRKTGVIWI